MSAFGLALVVGLAGLCSSAAGADERWVPPTEREQFHVFLLLGQSNMSGFAQLEAGDEVPVPHVLRVLTTATNDFAWQPAAHPLHNRLDSDRFGLGLPFAIAYLKSHPGVTVGLIPVGWGGAPIAQLNKGTQTYLNVVAKARWAKGQGVIKGVLWHQGESDTVVEELARSYAAKLDSIVADLRTDLGDPSLPFIAGELAPFYGTVPDHNAPDRVVRIATVQQALRDLPNRVRHTACASSKGLRSADGHMVHFDRASLIEFGKRYAAAMATLQQHAQ
ncbi:MAG: sialate O-acetylesterase [Verrucomicrobia bacterium]|nr:sialate O-acetylesterase [Verrucomicrobiota bacterium]